MEESGTLGRGRKYLNKGDIKCLLLDLTVFITQQSQRTQKPALKHTERLWHFLPAMKADLSVELAEAMLYADDAAAEVVKEFKSGKISLGVQELGTDKAAALLGATVDSKGVLNLRG